METRREEKSVSFRTDRALSKKFLSRRIVCRFAYITIAQQWRIDKRLLRFSTSFEAEEAGSRDSRQTPNRSAIANLIQHPQPVVWIAIAACIGITVDRAFSPEPWLLIALMASSWLSANACLGRGCDDSDRIRLVASVLLLVSISFLFAFGHHCRWSLFGRNDVAQYSGRHSSPVALRGVIASEPIERTIESDAPHRLATSTQTQFTLNVTEIRVGMEWQDASGKSRVIVHSHRQNWRLGDYLLLFGSIRRQSKPSNPGEPSFERDYRSKRELTIVNVRDREGIRVDPKFSSGSHAADQQLVAQLNRLRNQFRQRISIELSRLLDEQYVGFASALLLGSTDHLSQNERRLFSETGTSHLLAISGLHLAILISPLLVVCRVEILNRCFFFGFVILCVWCYAWFIEFRLPVFRASILITIFCVAKIRRRRAFSWNSIALAVVILLVIDPTSLFSLSGQLSFLAIMTLCYINKRTDDDDQISALRILIEQSFNRTERVTHACAAQLQRIGVVSFRLWIVSMPIVASVFHVWTPNAILANVVVLPLMPPTLFLGLTTILADLVDLPASTLLAKGFESLLAIIISSLTFIRNQGCHWTSGPPSWWVGLFYAVYFLFLMAAAIRRTGIELALFASFVLTLGILVSLDDLPKRMGLPSRHTRLTWIDVSHGTATLIELPNGQNILYDGGSLNGTESAIDRISSVLWYRRVHHLDAIILSHADIDHINGISGILERFSVSSCFINPAMLVNTNATMSEIRQKLRRYDIELRPLYQGMIFETGNSTEIVVEHPPRFANYRSSNEQSIVLRLKSFGYSILLTGDIERRALTDYLSQSVASTDVLVAPHHGSRLAPIETLLEQMAPSVVVISGASGDRSISSVNAYEHQGADVFHTAFDGAIEIRIDSTELRVATWIAPIDATPPRLNLLPQRFHQRVRIRK